MTGDHRNDLPRGPEGFALVGDHRNDENLIVAQTHLAMIHFHNRVLDKLPASVPDTQRFTRARKKVTAMGVAMMTSGNIRVKSSPSTTP